MGLWDGWDLRDPWDAGIGWSSFSLGGEELAHSPLLLLHSPCVLEVPSVPTHAECVFTCYMAYKQTIIPYGR